MYNIFLLMIQLTILDSVALVQLDRSPINLLNSAMFKDLLSCFDSISSSPQILAVVLCSQLKGFTAGLDLAEIKFTGSDPARISLSFLSAVRPFQDAITAIHNCPKPVIAAIHGFCIGGGLDIISACDVRLCTKDALFSVKEVDIGIAADLGTLQRLPKICGNNSWVRTVCLTAKQFGAQEALDNGLVSHVYLDKAELHSEAIKLAKLIASKPPLAVLGTKRSLNYSQDKSTAAGLEHVVLWNAAMINTKAFEFDLGYRHCN